MDRSFGASTSILHTPSPLDRRQRSSFPSSSSSALRQPSGLPTSLERKPSTSSPSTTTTASNGAYTTPAKPISSALTRSGSEGLAAKSVRFSPTQPAGFPSAAPPSRLISTSPPKSSVLGMGANYGTSTLATVQQKLPSALKASTSLPASPMRLPVSKKELAPPEGRGVVAQRLRVNSILLVMWWLGSRTNVYAYMSGHLVHLVPSLDTPLHVIELCALILVVYNIFESLYTLNRLSALTTPGVITYRQANTSSPSPMRPSSPSAFHSPVRSSPKTRPSPAMSPSPSITRISKSSSTNSPLSASTPNSSPFRKASPQSMTPQTPVSSTKSALSSLRRSTLGNGLPLAGSVGEGTSGEDGLLTAYLARHSPGLASNLHRSVNSQEAINRLLSD